MPSINTSLRLYFGSILVGLIKNPVERGGTWLGTFELARMQGAGLRDKRIRRIHEYIHFSEQWHARVDAGMPAAAAELDRYSDVTGDDQWSTVNAAGRTSGIKAPAFHTDGELSWEALGGGG